jgi:hypothetical protein
MLPEKSLPKDKRAFGRGATERANHWSSVIRSVGIHSLVSLRLDSSLFETFLSRRFMNTYARKFRFSSGG